MTGQTAAALCVVEALLLQGQRVLVCYCSAGWTEIKL